MCRLPPFLFFSSNPWFTARTGVFDETDIFFKNVKFKTLKKLGRIIFTSENMLKSLILIRFVTLTHPSLASPSWLANF